MVTIRIDGILVKANENETILQAAKRAGIYIPSLCYLKDLNEIGACRICVVEIKGKEKLISSCNNVVEDGMEIYTNSPKVREARKINVELILSQHNGHCPTCVRSGNCNLQKISNDLGIIDVPYKKEEPKFNWDLSIPLIRDESKCIKCMRCIQVCDKVQSLGVWDVAFTGSRTTVGVSENRDIKYADCSYCGQCITHCPVGALRERDDTAIVFNQLNKKNKITIVQVAPSVRAAWGEHFGLSSKFSNEKRLAAALRRIGFDYIFDTNFAADLTIMEEASELIKKLKNKKDGDMPMFTSCCPGWVRYINTQHPNLVKYLSTSKSPQQMFGAVVKTYYAKLLEVDPSEIFLVSIMPCVAKKDEVTWSGMDSSGKGPDVDVVLTTREFVRMLRAEHIHPKNLEEEEFDKPLGDYTGAGVIFGATGGVMEAALRSAYYFATGKKPPIEAFYDVRGRSGWREKTFDIDGIPVKIAVATGLRNARKLITALERGEVSYDFVEVMACPGGCVGGGGQPITDGEEFSVDRAWSLYTIDDKCVLRSSYENPSIQELYSSYLGKPLSEKAEKLLHRNQKDGLYKKQ
ncbi:[FeFe] hydrogenase, group A [Clostridium fallax]|uniref:NADH-quinone oxidoreductase subunit G n=1 Tax=Clostridium fallax TaxID=1533 RepID=A0A1M4XYV6_9CLOT|nr:[FeFe] hydrogenase, group A [Clostridium fallax]SHE98608.1 NADH-quinone oxidoreductase subunit G [Clostridium fallax]SQB06486.1 NADP-reducing hydrogenase subunit HndC [Clostridium fallax]